MPGGEEATAATLGEERWPGGIFKRLESATIKNSRRIRIYEYKTMSNLLGGSMVYTIGTGHKNVEWPFNDFKSRPAKCGN